MTARAVSYALRSLRIRRRLYGGYRWRLLESLAGTRFCRSGPRSRQTSNPVLASSRSAPALRTQAPPSARTLHWSKSVEERDTEFCLDMSTQGRPLGNDRVRMMTLAEALLDDAVRAMKELVWWHQRTQMLYLNKEAIELSLILSDDHHIHKLNAQYLNEDRPTDVLSFPMDGGEEDHLPVMLLGDIILSVDTAARQAKQMGHGLLRECRILLVHGLLHLFGYDHDRNDEGWNEMARMEKQTLAALGWSTTGLISNTKRIMLSAEIEQSNPIVSSDEEKTIRDQTKVDPPSQPKSEASPTVVVPAEKDRMQLVALDLDGTLLTSDQQITDRTKEAIEEALDRGIRVVIATGKARPGAIAACQKFGLYGKQSLIGHDSAGIFLQGLVVHTLTGEPLTGPSIPPDVVRSAFQYASANDVSCVAFTGDACVTLKLTPELLELHERYYEPKAEELNSVDGILDGKPVKKIVLLSDPADIQNEIRPHFDERLNGSSSTTTLSVPSMLELLPRGVNKWVGLSSLLDSMEISYRSCMAVGDGSNDYEMVKHAAVGVAMGNAVDEVKSVADLVVSSNDDDGIAEAFERFILS